MAAQLFDNVLRLHRHIFVWFFCFFPVFLFCFVLFVCLLFLLFVIVVF